MNKKGLLVISFGTSYVEAREENIVPIERAIAEAMPEREMRRAFSSRMIIRKLRERDGMMIDSVEEALEKMAEEGFSDLLIQPTFIIHGFEFDEMMEIIGTYRHKFEVLKVGQPLLHVHKDYLTLCEGLKESFSIENTSEALVFMGHGTEHPANVSYPALESYMHNMGCRNVFIGTVEGYPDIDVVRGKLKENGYEKVTLAPLMVVAGDHALNDMAGDDEESWKSVLEADGFVVDCVLKGMGSYGLVRRIFVDHALDAR